MSASTQHKLRVLFVDDEVPIRKVMKMELERMGHDATICESGEEAINQLARNTFDAAIVDLRMPGLTGWDVIDHIKSTSPATEVIISTGDGNMEDAIQAVRRGAYDFIPKPCKLFEIANVLQRVGDKRQLQHKTIALESRLKQVAGTSNMIGKTAPMQRVQKLIEKIAPTDSTALILGETGTGKELVASQIHDLSTRANAPFVPVNCGALPEHLVESEFFGHRKGAFTGADSNRKGLIEVANGGTLFLDELGELDKSMQVKLLRFLESGEIRRLGENEPFHVDVRVICATHRDLQEMVHEGSFREDLFFRVNTFEIHLPPLRERREDIPELARFLLRRQAKKPNLPDEVLTVDAIELLLAHDWPGNVRELKNVMEHALILWNGQTITPDDLPVSVTRRRPRNGTPAGKTSFCLGSEPMTMREIEMQVIYQVLDKHNGDKPKTAEELGIALKTLYNKLNQYQSQSEAG